MFFTCLRACFSHIWTKNRNLWAWFDPKKINQQQFRSLINFLARILRDATNYFHDQLINLLLIILSIKCCEETPARASQRPRCHPQMCCFAEEKSETKDTQLTLTYDKDKQQIPLNIVDLFHVLGLINYKNSCFFSVDQLMECVSSTNIKLTQVSVSQMRGYILYRKLNMSEFWSVNQTKQAISEENTVWS